MPILGVIAGAILLALMTLTGFQIVPESAKNYTSTDRGYSNSGPQISVSEQATPAPTVSGSIVSSRATTVSIQRPQDIESDRAALRGSVVVDGEDLGSSFFVYSYNPTSLNSSLVVADSYESLLELKRSNVSVARADRQVDRSENYRVGVSGLAPDSRYYVQLCVERSVSLLCSDTERFDTPVGATRASDAQEPRIRVHDETIIDSERVQIQVEVDMNDTEDGRVYVVYGESRNLVNEAREDEYSDINESGDRLQKSRAANGVRGSIEIIKILSDLDDNTEYYYAVCLSYDGVLDGFVCTRTNSFVTPDDDFGATPTVQTDSVQVRGTSATLNGYVSMRPLRNGQVFFVYGTDSRKIQAIGGEMSFDSIRQSGDRLQRIKIDSNLNSAQDYSRTVIDLLINTEYVSRLCVAYENENERSRDVDFVTCGSTVSFQTQI